MSLTGIHVVLSLVAIATGFVAIAGLANGRSLAGWTWIYLATSVATNVTAFMFPFRQFLPAHAIAIVSLALLALAAMGLYRRGFRPPWRTIYVIAIVWSLYLNAFIFVVQAFLKTPVLTALAPTQHEVPFLVTQVVVLMAFVWLTRTVLRGFK